MRCIHLEHASAANTNLFKSSLKLHTLIKAVGRQSPRGPTNGRIHGPKYILFRVWMYVEYSQGLLLILCETDVFFLHF